VLGYSEREVCRALGQSRGAFRKPVKRSNDEESLTKDIIRLATKYGRYGYKRITALLRIEGWRVIASRLDLTSEKNRKKYEKLLSMFGKLELRYTWTHCHSRFGSHIAVAAYTVVAKDEFSVAVLSRQPLVGTQISHIHFEGNHYWIYLGSGGLREFFKCVSTKPRHTARKNR
jgi:hypothetical protein